MYLCMSPRVRVRISTYPCEKKNQTRWRMARECRGARCSGVSINNVRRRRKDWRARYKKKRQQSQSLQKALPSTTVLKSLQKEGPSSTSCYKSLQQVSQYYFVLQSLQREGPRNTSHCKACAGGERGKTATTTTSYYKAWTKHFPILLCNTKLARGTSQYYVVLQKLAASNPVLLCTTKLAESTSQHNFVLQSLHRGREGARGQPVLLGTTKLGPSKQINK